MGRGLTLIVVAVSTVFALASPLAAQNAQTAPAIGPWLGAPRGSISAVAALDGSIAIEGEVRDPDSPRPVSYELTVDGLVAATGATARPDDFGATVTFSETLRVSDGLHTVCLRLLDQRFGNRTVDCTRATTSPPDTVRPRAVRFATGAVVSPTGVVVPVVGGDEGEWQVTTPCGAETSLTSGTFIERARVVIDPGHGGSESGAVRGSLVEKHLNLEIAELVVEQLEALGISAQLTRTADYRVPIKTRADIANALAPDVFLSIHHNGGATRRSTRPGTEVFYTREDADSERLARVMYDEMVGSLAPYGAAWVSTVSEGASLRLRDDGMDLYGIHRFSPLLTSVITEFLYISNPSEAALMQRQELKQVEADAIVDALLRWWWTDDQGTTLGREFTDSSSTGTGGFDGCTDPALTFRPTPLEFGRREAASPDVVAPLIPALFLGSDPSVS